MGFVRVADRLLNRDAERSDYLLDPEINMTMTDLRKSEAVQTCKNVSLLPVQPGSLTHEDIHRRLLGIYYSPSLELVRPRFVLSGRK